MLNKYIYDYHRMTLIAR